MKADALAAVPLVVKEVASCPVCGSDCSNEPLARYSARAAATHFCPAQRNALRHQRLVRCIQRLWAADECVILRCRECGFAFAYPHIGGDEEFYAILHEQKGYPGWRWDYDFAIHQGLSHFSGGKILDIGAGVGAFLKRLGAAWQRVAIEASDSNRDDLTAAGITVLHDLGTACPAQAGSFQVITVFQVLEHMADFRSLLQRCRRLLAADGRLVITVPDADAMLAQELLTGCADMPPNHVNKFTPRSLSLVLKQNGFDTLMTVPEPPSWRHVLSMLHLRIMADAYSGRSLAAQIYRIRQRRLRQFGLALLAIPALFRLLPALAALRKGGSFGIVATPADWKS